MEAESEGRKMKAMPNERTVNIKIRRGELCKLLIALLCFDGEDEKHIRKIHDNLRQQLDEFDLKLKMEDEEKK